MDPQATWTMLLAAYQTNDWPLVEEAAEALLTWLARGGFPPALEGLDDAQTRLIVQLFCRQALASSPESLR